MSFGLKAVSLTALAAGAVFGTPIDSPKLQARRLLGSSFGVAGDDATFDYVIVGGGTAGLTLATRLVEQQAGSVAVVEAGTFYEIGNGNLSQVPGNDGAFTGKGVTDWQPLIDWGYLTTPQAGAYNATLHYTQGKTLGGSSARNFMVYQRGTEGSYQMWADQVGDDSYEWANFLPWFEKSVNFSEPNMEKRPANSTPVYDAAVLGNRGPLSVSYTNYPQVLATWAVKGLEKIGLSIIDGLNSGKLIGQSYGTFTIDGDTMIRSSSETAFLRQGLDNPDLTVYQLALAKKILFDDDKKATGVVVDTEGLEYTLSARKEVIVSAGTFGSPQLLLVSGVGPAETLTQYDIPVIADRPGVGQGMQDHIYFGISYRVIAPTFSSLLIPSYVAEQAELFNTNATGIFTNPTADVLAWEKIPEPLRSGMSSSTLAALAEYPDDWPEAEYISLGSYLGTDVDSRRGDPGDGYNYGTLVVAVVAPRSRGFVSISSADTSVHPIINPNHFTDQTDVDVGVAAFKRAREFWATDVMQEFVIGGESYPGANFTTDAQIEDVIRRSYNAIYHASCTNAMGKEDNPMAVVDTQGRVYGVESLRVVDASALPLLPPGHPQSTIYAMTEKIACDMSGNC
ncbi:Uu.00g105710.m01.CDS01 [Anthostomella pinea]|uniref:Uu.00g105710.m01.CDS01 n=1 Tax=Anthostomella pinea TaxID=933095 RepID=A0AAI8YFT7_9PEZI|nr:Uu.00g105710.m01.CDS01 [Anthostomella pinea]